MPFWMYGPRGEAAIFDDEADVPQGWRDHPFKPDPPVAGARKGGSLSGKRKAKS